MGCLRRANVLKKILVVAAVVSFAASMLSAQIPVNKNGASAADTLIVSRSVYEGTHTRRTDLSWWGSCNSDVEAKCPLGSFVDFMARE